MEQNLFSGTLGMIILFIMLLAAVLWFFLPFAVFGIKPRIDELIKINKETNVLLESINSEVIELRKSSDSENTHSNSSHEDQDKT